ncbi:MAG TPA: glycosyltransferase [Terriglobales bacterium]|nr:glycosyltransferase [Terriglobales bacterium]
MKFTIFGLSISSSWGNGHATPYRAILKALHGQGHQITFFEKDVPYYARHRDLAYPNFCKLVLYSDWSEIRTEALRESGESDVALCASYCPEGAEIIDDVLDLPRPLKLFYDLDTPVTLAALERGKVECLRASQMPEFDLYLSFTGGGTLDELTSHWGVQRAAALYGCVDPDAHRSIAPRAEFMCDLSYMATYAPDRQQKVSKLLLSPAAKLPSRKFVLAGSMYPAAMKWPNNVSHFEHVAPTEHSALYSSSRLTLNVTRGDMSRWGYCPSGRLFEAAACGTPLISDWFEGLDTFFDPTAGEIVIAHEDNDVIAAIELSDEELARMARRARERTLSEHTGEQRARELVSAIEQVASHSDVERARSEVA